MTGWNETPTDVATRVRAWKLGMGDWLRGYQWSHWVTLTVDGQWPAERLLRAFHDEFVRFATKVAQGPVQYAFVVEGGVLGDQAHLHALISGTETAASKRLERAWRHGRAHVRSYQPSLGAAHYLTKEIGGRVLDYGVSRRMRPLRSHDPDATPAPIQDHPAAGTNASRHTEG